MNLFTQRLLEGHLDLPNYKGFANTIGNEDADTASKFFKAMWQAYLKDKGKVSLPYWSAKFNSQDNFNVVLKSLSSAKWIISNVVPARNWADAWINEDKLLQFISLDQLETVRASNKFQKYTLSQVESTKTKATRLNGKVRDTGLVREGFMKAGNTKFSYDTNMIEEYKPIIQANLTKSMDKIAEIWPELRHDKASYDTISVEMLNYYTHSTEVYTRGDNYNDSRGRAISSSLGKIGNPVSSKDFRALLVIE